MNRLENSPYFTRPLGIVLPEEFHIKEKNGMICGSAEAEARDYFCHETVNGDIWLWANQPNAGDNIYVWLKNETRRDGFGGRELSFKLVSGQTLKLKGPWHSNSEALLKATGVDLTSCHYTSGVIALERDIKDFYNQVYRRLLHLDNGWILGKFDRIKTIAQDLANNLNQKLYYYRRSIGGSCSSQVTPE